MGDRLHFGRITLMLVAGVPDTEAPSDLLGGDRFREIVLALNAAREDYIVARRLFLGADAAERRLEDEYTHFADEHGVPSSARLAEFKVSMRLAFDCLDKVGWALNSYWSLGVPARQVYFGRIVSERRKRLGTPHDRAASPMALCGVVGLSSDNPWFNALESLATAVDPPKDSKISQLPGVHESIPTLKERRDRGTHRYTLIRDGDEDPDGLALTPRGLRNQALEALRMTRSALQYVHFGIDHDSATRRREGAQVDAGTFRVGSPARRGESSATCVALKQ